MVPMLVDHCCLLTDSLQASDLFGFRRRDLPLCISAVALKPWLAHADDQRDEFTLGTVSVKCCSLLAQRHRPSSSVALTAGRQQATLHHGPLPSTCEFMQSAQIACPCFTRPRFKLGLSRRALLRQTSSTLMTHQVAGFSVNPSRPFMANLSSSTFAWVVVALDVFKDSAMTSSRKDNKFFACLYSTVESSSEVSPLVCAHLTRKDSSLASPLPLGRTASASKKATFSQ